MDNRASDYSLGIDRGEWIEFPPTPPLKKLDPEGERLLREHLDRVWARNLRMERDL